MYVRHDVHHYSFQYHESLIKREKCAQIAAIEKFSKREMHNSVQRTENERKIFIRAAIYKNRCSYNILIEVSEIQDV